MKTSLPLALMPQLDSHRFISVMLFLCFITMAQAQGQISEGNLLTSAQAVRQLSALEAAKGYPVRLRGVVLHFNEKADGELMIQDYTEAIYVTGTAQKQYRLKPGQIVQVDGVTGSGDFAPIVIASHVSVLGEGKLPVPRERTFEQLAAGIEDGQWVNVSGIVRSATIEPLPGYTRLSLELATGGNRLTVRVPHVESIDLAALIDCDATVTGICFPVFNRRRQLLTVRLRAPSLEQITFRKPAQAASFDTVGRTINSLMQFDPNVSHGHRVKVEGIVTLQMPGEFLFIRDANQGLWVKTRERTPVKPGDVVQVLGFPAFGEFNPVLEDAIYSKSGTASPLKASPITISQARSGEFDAELVQLEGSVLDLTKTGTEWVLVLEEKDSIFRARLPASPASGADPVAVPGSRVQLTGICLMPPGNQAPHSFELLLRSKDDLRVLSSPSWWTVRRVASALGIMTAVSFCAFAWLWTLRKRVRFQTIEIQRKVERETVLEERTRIAREYHDTLEQQLAAVILQVQAARNWRVRAPDQADQILENAESMLRHTQTEARNSVWDLRARALENGSLDSALRAVADYARNGSPTVIKLEVVGKPYSMASRIENNLLRIGQEAVSNAVKHAHPSCIFLALRYESEAVRLVVEDNGAGFNAGTAASSEAGHFGLLGMRERAEKIGGELKLTSAPGEGTRIELTVPAPGQRTALSEIM